MAEDQTVTTDEEKERWGYDAGIKAAEQGEPETANPYYQHTPEWRGWQRGWHKHHDAA